MKIHTSLKGFTLDSSSLLFNNSFLAAYFEHFNEFTSSGLLELSNDVFVPFQLINQDFSGISKTYKNSFIHKCFGKSAISLVEQLISSSDKSMKILLVGNIFITGSAGFCSNTKVKNAELVNKDLCKKLFKHFKDCDMILLKDCCSDKIDGFVQIPVLPEMSLAIHSEWESLNDYLKALSSKYRVRMNSALSKIKGLEIQSFTPDEIETHISDFEALFMQVYERAEYKIIPAKINFLVKLKKHFPENFHVNVWKKDGKIVAFNSLLIDEQKAHAMMIGMDYSCNDTYKLYQNILINLIDSSIHHKVKLLNFGRTAMEIKSAVGAEPVDSFVNVRFRSKTHQLIFKKLIQSYTIPEWVQRKPFKIPADHLSHYEGSFQAVDSL